MDEPKPTQPSASMEPVTTNEQSSSNPSESPLSSSQSPVTPPPTAKKKRKGLLIGGIIAGALVLLAGGGVLAYTFWYQNPEKVVTDAVVNAIKARTMTYTGSVTMEGDFKLKVELSGANDAAKSDMVAKVTFPMGEMEHTIETSARFDGNGDLFLKIKDINAIVDSYRAALPPESLAALDQLVAKINDRWIKISADDLAQFDEATSKRQKCVSDAIKKYYQDDKAIAEVAEVYKKNKFITIKQDLGSKEGSLGYSLEGDQKKAEAFFKGLKDTKVYKTLHDCDPEFTIDEKESAEQTKPEKSQDATVELWVHQWTHQVTEVKVATKDKETKNSMTGLLKPRFDEKVTIETPKESVTLKELQAEIEEIMTSAINAQMNEEAMTAEEAAMLQEFDASNEL